MASSLHHAFLVAAWVVFISVTALAATSSALPAQPAIIRTVTDVSSDEDRTTKNYKSAPLQAVVQSSQLGGIDSSVYHFPSFPDPPPGLNLIRSAKVVNGAVQLISGANNEIGAFYSKVPIRFYNKLRGVAGVFGTSFQYQFVNPSPDRLSVGDGFVFTLTADSGAIGDLGGSFGYAGSGNKQSVAIEFDTFLNPTINDPNNNHIGFDAQDTVVSVKTNGTLPFDLVNNGKPVFAWIQFWPQGTPLTFKIQVFISQKPIKPDFPVLEANADLKAILFVAKEDEIFIGFSAATAGAVATIQIAEWDFFSATLQ